MATTPRPRSAIDGSTRPLKRVGAYVDFRATRWLAICAGVLLAVACSQQVLPMPVEGNRAKTVPVGSAPLPTPVSPPVRSASSPPPVNVALAACATFEPGTPAAPLVGEPLEHARVNIMQNAAREQLAAALGVDCVPAAPSFDVALAQAVARFQRRYGRFEDDVTGQLNARTERVLRMVHPALRAADHPCGAGASVGSAHGPVSLPPCLLRWQGASAEQRAFMHLVYDVARKRAARRRAFVAAADEVAVIERGPCPGKPSTVEPGCSKTQWAQRAAAGAARRLLVAARTHFAADGKRHGQRNLMVFTGYRSAPFQLEIWEYHFPTRYRATRAARARARGGPHGPAAALLLAQHFAVRTAPPGHSLHNRGLAIDFGCVTRAGAWIGSTGSFTKAWKKSYCFRWLKSHAAGFGFRPNEKIDEPWHWEFVGKMSP